MKSILYVEDNEDNAYMLSKRLKKRGFEVLIAENGLLGVESSLENSPDLILMDLSMPEMDGWEATRVIKNNPVTKEIPIIILTAHAMAGDSEKALKTGAEDYDTKPINFKRLLVKINRILELS
jgi:CheY-like chemotaxis protein